MKKTSTVFWLTVEHKWGTDTHLFASEKALVAEIRRVVHDTWGSGDDNSDPRDLYFSLSDADNRDVFLSWGDQELPIQL